MEEKNVYTLKIDPQFKDLIRPLSKKEYLQLEENLIADGCRDPIITWKGYIIDGHNRYEICHRHNIPFYIIEKDFESTESAIAWICANQLGRRNISEETRKFLIGKQYESEKIILKAKNELGLNQFNNTIRDSLDDFVEQEKSKKDSRHQTARRIGEENGICYGTVEKYALYSKAVEKIKEKSPEMYPNILSGRYKISHNNVIHLSELSPEEINKVGRRLERNKRVFKQYKTTRFEINNCSDPEKDNPAPSVKDMPKYDPDAEINGLSLTAPSWVNSLRKVRNGLNTEKVSNEAKVKLLKSLFKLRSEVDILISLIKES